MLFSESLVQLVVITTDLPSHENLHFTATHLEPTLFTDSGPWRAAPRSRDATKPLSDNLAETTKPADRLTPTTKPAMT